MFYVQYKDKPEDATEAITQKFLGVQLQCARCHDHPFEDWRQTDFYGVAAFLYRVKVVDVGTKNKIKAYAIGEMNRGDIQFTGPVQQDQVGKKGEPVKPRFLNGDALQEPELAENVKDPRNFPSGKMPPPPEHSRKDKLADWVTSPKNPYFTKAVVNRIWGQFFGKGIVDPVDNLSDSNPPSHPELFTELEQSLIDHNYDLKWFIRELLNSKTYQLSSSGTVSEEKPLWYERARFRPLSAEELFESWMTASSYDEVLKQSNRIPKKRFEAQSITWDYFRRFFGKPSDGVGNFQGGLAEHLFLNNGQVHSMISKSKGGLYDAMANGKLSSEEKVNRLFLQILSRKPSEAETKTFAAHLESKDDERNRIHEAIWTLMTCSEFRFNH